MADAPKKPASRGGVVKRVATRAANPVSKTRAQAPSKKSLVSKKTLTTSIVGVKPRAVTRRKSNLNNETVLLPTPPRTLPTQKPEIHDDDLVGVQVTLPSNISARLQAKQRALVVWYRERFPQYAARSAQIIGGVFIALGTLFQLPYLFDRFPDWQSFQSAALTLALEGTSNTSISTDTTIIQNTTTQTSGSGGGSGTTTTTQTTTSNTNGTVPMPEVYYDNYPPSPLDGLFEQRIKALNLTAVRLEVRNVETNTRKILSPNLSGSDGRFVFILRPADYDAGSYRLVVEGKDASGTVKRFPDPQQRQFEVVLPEEQVAADPLDTTTTDESTDTAVSDTSTIDDEGVDEPALWIKEIDVRSATSTFVHIDADSTVRLVVRVFEESTKTVRQQGSPTFTRNGWVYRIDNGLLREGLHRVVVRIENTTVSEESTFYPKKEVATTWSSPNTTTTPTTRTQPISSIAPTSPTVTPTPTPVPTPSPTPTAPRTEPSTAPVPVVSTPSPAPVPVPPPLAPRLLPPPPPPETLPVPERFVREQFKAEENSFNDLFRRYADAIARGATEDIEAAETAITEAKESLKGKAVESGVSEDDLSAVEEQLVRKVTRVKEKVITFETVVKDRAAALDTDSDGVTDIDENTVYKTDPKNPDTDGDGISDADELLRGMDPRSATTTDLIPFASPKEFAPVRDDILAINDVKADTENTAEAKPVFAGKALPNSFVTLYVFSTPLVVTVKTDSDGSFVFRFDEELEDGSHEVYVAMTDSTGDIVAKSNPFQFVKEAQAFSPVGVEGATVVTSDPAAPSATTQSIYHVIVAMAVLAFGLILLLLGVLMRRDSGAVITSDTTTPGATV